MKKFMYVLLLIFIPAICNAQRFKGGVVLGLNVSQIDGDFWAGYNKAGLVGGAFVFTKFTEGWGGQMEIRYSAKGSATAPKSTVQRKIRLQYMELPLLATYDFYHNFQAQGGVSLGYLFEAAQNDGYGYEEFDEFDHFEIALSVGMNYSVLDRIDINVRFSYSILPIEAYYSGATFPYAKTNNVITFAVYYRIGG